MTSQVYMRNMFLMPLFIGLCAGIFITFDPYIVNFIHLELLKLFPYEFAAIVTAVIIGSMLLLLIFRKKFTDIGSLFILLLLIGYQTNAVIMLFVVNGDELVIGVFALLLCLIVFVNKEFTFTRSPINVLTLIFACAVFISLINGFSLRYFFMFLKTIMLLFLIINFVKTREHVYFFIRTFIIITAISALIGIVQEFIYIYYGYPLTGFISAKQLEMMFESTPFGRFLRVPALMLGYKVFAMILVINLLVLLNLLIYRSPYVKDAMRRRLYYFAFFIMLGALICTFSKDAWLALLAGLSLSVLIRWRSLTIHFTMVLLLIIILSHYTGLDKMAYRFISSEITHGEARGRIELNKEGLDGFLRSDSRYYAFGRGLGNGWRYTPHHRGWAAHNAFILAADEIGLFGFLAYMLLFLFAAYRLILANVIARQVHDKAIARGLLCGFVSIIIIMQFHSAFIEPLFWIFFGIIECFTLQLIKGDEYDVALKNELLAPAG
jgi:hypothetical protein